MVKMCNEIMYLLTVTNSYWFLSRTLRFLCCREMLWITMRSFRLFWVAAAPTGTLPAFGDIRRS